MTTVIGMLSGAAFSLVKKREVVPTALLFTRRGFLVGVILTPILVEGTLKTTKSGPEEVYDRVYRIRYNDSQIRSAQWSTYIPIVTAAAGAYMAKPPTTRLLGGINGLLVGYAGATVGSAVIPIGNGRQKGDKEKSQSEAAPTN